MDRITNEAVLEKVNKHKELLYIVKKLGIWTYNEGRQILHFTTYNEEENTRKRRPGQRRISWLYNSRRFKSAVSKIKITLTIINLH